MERSVRSKSHYNGEVGHIDLEEVSTHAEGKTIAGIEFTNGGGYYDTEGQRYDPRQPEDRIIIKLRDGNGNISELQIELVDGQDMDAEPQPYFEAFYTENPAEFYKE